MKFNEAQQLKVQKAFLLGALTRDDIDEEERSVTFEAFKIVKTSLEEAERKKDE